MFDNRCTKNHDMNRYQLERDSINLRNQANKILKIEKIKSNIHA